MTRLSWPAQYFPGFSTESLIFWETAQFPKDGDGRALHTHKHTTFKLKLKLGVREETKVRLCPSTTLRDKHRWLHVTSSSWSSWASCLLGDEAGRHALDCFQPCLSLQDVRAPRSSRSDQFSILGSFANNTCLSSSYFWTGRMNMFSLLGWAYECTNSQGSQY